MLQSSPNVKFPGNQVNSRTRIKIKFIVKQRRLCGGYRTGYKSKLRIYLIAEYEFTPVEGTIGNACLQAKRQYKILGTYAIRINPRNIVFSQIGCAFTAAGKYHAYAAAKFWYVVINRCG